MSLLRNDHGHEQGLVGMAPAKQRFSTGKPLVYIYACMRCSYRIEVDHRRTVPFRRPHEDRREDTEGVAPPRCNGQFKRVWTAPNLNGLETR